MFLHFPQTFAIDDVFYIPKDLQNLADFRRWAKSDDFPKRGRIDYIDGTIHVDMSLQDLFTHGTPKTEVATSIARCVEELDLGHTFISKARFSSVPGDVSAEPDVMVVAFEAEDEGRVKYTPKASGEEGRYVGVEGAPDLIVEIVSDSSQAKDTKRLPPAYFAAGVREFWLIDARSKDLRFEIHHRGDASFQTAPADADGYQSSEVFSASYRLERDRHRRGHWVYRLQCRRPALDRFPPKLFVHRCTSGGRGPNERDSSHCPTRSQSRQRRQVTAWRRESQVGWRGNMRGVAAATAGVGGGTPYNRRGTWRRIGYGPIDRTPAVARATLSLRNTRRTWDSHPTLSPAVAAANRKSRSLPPSPPSEGATYVGDHVRQWDSSSTSTAIAAPVGYSCRSDGVAPNQPPCISVRFYERESAAIAAQVPIRSALTTILRKM